MKKLSDKVAVITGGGRGIGREIAFAFAREGASIAVLARTAEQGREVASEIESACGTKAMHAACDVSQRESVDEAFAEVVEHFGQIDILVNNAGIAESAPLLKTTDEMWRKIIGINLDGTFYATRAALPYMLEHGWGRIINIASIAGKTGAPYITAYTASKHAVVGLTRALALEVVTRGVTVNAICPGYVETEMAAHAIKNITAKTGKTMEEARDILNRMSPQNRLLSTEEVAALALLLASDEGRGINGQAINIDGGSVLC